MEKELWWIYDSKSNNIPNSRKILGWIWNIVYLLFFKFTPHPLFNKWRVLILKIFGAKIGKGVFISPRSFIFYPWNFEMGDKSAIDDYVFIKSTCKVVIGSYSSISNFVHIFPGGHDVRTRNFENNRLPIHIGNSVFIGANSYIGRGVTIGDFTVIGACSVVLKNIPENVIAFGNPATIHSTRISKDEFIKYRYN